MFNTIPTYSPAVVDTRVMFAVARPCDQGWLHVGRNLVGRSKR